eukprot:TRINITY_DN7078_c0_g1_i4.p1 TRINITY_DN7078_c0_g1~~TRINITY_DN7078_c0_g1_i4.p1  ORF type:complete len:230 (+),score=30.74 TRINITY_DN7078_c0_g1_i4:92-781(+)
MNPKLIQKRLSLQFEESQGKKQMLMNCQTKNSIGQVEPKKQKSYKASLKQPKLMLPKWGSGQRLRVLKALLLFLVQPVGVKKTVGETEMKRKEIEKLTKELKDKEEEYKAMKMKYSAATARVATLEKESKDVKGGDVKKMKVLIEKSENDDRLIEALRSEITKLRTLNSVSSSSQKIDLKLHEKINADISKLQSETAVLREEKSELIRNVMQKEQQLNAIMASIYSKKK